MRGLPVALCRTLLLPFLFLLIMARCSLRRGSVPVREIAMSSELAMLNQHKLTCCIRMIERGVDHERVDAPASLPDGRYVAPRLERVQLVATIGCSLLFTTTRRSAQPGGGVSCRRSGYSTAAGN